MTLGVMQAYFFPYIGYFQLIRAVDKFVLYGNVQYMKKSWITRNRILDKGTKKPVYIKTQISLKSHKQDIIDTTISGCDSWRNQLKKQIYFNYKKASYFDEVFPILEEIIDYTTTSIHDYNSNAIITLSGYLKIDTEITSVVPWSDHFEEELRNSATLPGCDLKTTRVIKLCEAFGAILETG